MKGSGSNCVVSEVRNRVGLTAANSSYDGRWLVTAAQLTVTSDTPPILNGVIAIAGVATKNTADMALAFFANASGVSLRCNTGTSTPPADSAANEPC